MSLRVETKDGSVRFGVRVTPRAGRTEAVGLHGGALRIRLAAAPVDGKANDELVRLLARELGVPRSAVAIVRGEAGRSKTVEVVGNPVSIAAALQDLANRD